MHESAEYCIIGYWRSNDVGGVLTVRNGTDLHKYWYSNEQEAESGFCEARKGRAARQWHWQIVTVNLDTKLTPCVLEFSWNVMAYGDAQEGKWRGNWRMEWGSQYPSHYLGTWCIQHYYRWCRTPRLPVVNWTDPSADLNGLVRFAERRNLVSASVPSRFKSSLTMPFTVTLHFPLGIIAKNVRRKICVDEIFETFACNNKTW